MKNSQFLAYSLLASLFTLQIEAAAPRAKRKATQTVEVTNNSHQSMHITADNPAQMLKIDQWIPAYTHSLIISVMTPLQSPQEMLYAAIENDSIVEIINAVSAGADVNQDIEGQSPLLLSVLLKRSNAIKCLVALGAH